MFKRKNGCIVCQTTQPFNYLTITTNTRMSFHAIRSAAISVSNNIAEGFDSKSKKEFMRFLGIARNSSNEVESMCYLAERLNYIEVPQKDNLLLFCEEATGMIAG